MNRKVKIAILDDYQDVALSYADWASVSDKAEITVFTDHLADEAAVIRRLQGFAIVCVMRERTPLTFMVLSGLPDLKLIISTGKRNASIDLKATAILNIEVRHTGYVDSGAPELTWALLMAAARNLPREFQNVRQRGWQTSIGTDLNGKTIGIIGLGLIGSKIATYARAFGMNVIAWSQNLTAEKAIASGGELVDKTTLFRNADFITVHLILSERTRHIIGADELSLMKPGAFFINTSRGALVDEAALIDVLRQKKIAGAALDVYDTEPLAHDHPFRKLDNVLATPHIGYVTEKTYKVFYEDTLKDIHKWLNDYHPG